ncbi:MAG: hypothetical protein U0Z17_08390 [Bacteroidales bacterium]
MDETATCQVVAPDHHFLESWNDAEPKKGLYSLQQQPSGIFSIPARLRIACWKWAGNTTAFNAYLKNYWQQNFTSKQSEFASPATFWNNTLQRGVFELPASEIKVSFSALPVAEAAAKLHLLKQRN